MSIINIPYCFLFIPLIFSSINVLQNFKLTNKIITMSVVSLMLCLAVYLIPSVLPNLTLQSKINNESLFILGEYKITLRNLIFMILVFFVKLVSFMFFDDKRVFTRKLNFFFALYLINYFAICGIFMSNNIFNIFIYTEFYSFTLYNLMADYKDAYFMNISYQYYSNGVIGSLFLMLFTLVVYFTFGSADIDFIYKNIDIVSNNYTYNASILILLLAIVFKFFSFHFYFSNIAKSQNMLNMLFANILFVDISIGVYVLWKYIYLLFDTRIIFDILHINYLFYLVGSAFIIYGSYCLYNRKNLLPNVCSFSLVVLGYIVILLGIDNHYSFVSIISLLINHVLTNFLFYIITVLCVRLFGRSDVSILYAFNNYKVIIYALLLSKMLFPVALGFNAYWNFVIAVFRDKKYYLAIPLVIEKISLASVFVRYYFVFCRERKKHMFLQNLDNKITLKTDYMLVILSMFFLIVVVSMSGGVVTDILLNHITVDNV